MKIENGYLKAVEKTIRNGKNEEVFLRGVGLGNWLLPEGYMWRFKSPTDRPRRIEALVAGLLGDTAALDFWREFRASYITEADIARIAEEGFNSIRLPINWRVLMDDQTGEYKNDGWELIDHCIGWCKAHDLYVILDLHGAPGGQTGDNIDNSEANHPELYRSEKYRSWTVRLWRDIAARYVDESIVAAYDLLNEPLPHHHGAFQYQGVLVDIYREITQAIREVDIQHIIMYEGAHWATDFSMIQERFDDNMVLQFHKYWNNPDIESLSKYLEKRDQLDVPIFMGESGENNLDWYSGAFQLFEDFGIGWNFWLWKKLDTINSPCSIRRPANWESVLSYVNEGGEKPSREMAASVFQEYLENIRLDRCDYHQNVVHALMRRVPFEINAEFYGYQGADVSYHTLADNAKGAGLRRTDGVIVEHVVLESTVIPEYRHTNDHIRPENENLCIRLHAGEWASYEFNLVSEAAISIDIRLQNLDAHLSDVGISVDAKYVQTNCIEGSAWQMLIVTTKSAYTPGRHTLQLKVSEGTVRVDTLAFVVHTI